MTFDLTHDPEAHTYSKRGDPVAVEIAAQDGVLKTLEGDVAYACGDALLTGVAGERWPIGRAHFEAIYEPVPPTVQGQSGRYKRLPNRVLAKEMRVAFDVALGERGVLRGKPGDWLIQYAPGDLAVIDAGIFGQTYIPVASRDER
jgi:hypothetical protein